MHVPAAVTINIRKGRGGGATTVPKLTSLPLLICQIFMMDERICCKSGMVGHTSMHRQHRLVFEFMLLYKTGFVENSNFLKCECKTIIVSSKSIKTK